MTTGSLCPGCRSERNREINQARGSSTQQGYGARWRKARIHYLAEHPLCVHCLEDGRTQAGSVVDHIVPHRGDQTLFWDTSNWQTLCDHHDRIKKMDEPGARGVGGRLRSRKEMGGG